MIHLCSTADVDLAPLLCHLHGPASIGSLQGHVKKCIVSSLQNAQYGVSTKDQGLRTLCKL